MDCFKLEAETIDYLQKQHNNFNNIIQILSNISQIDQQILSLFPISKQFQQIQQFIYDQLNQPKLCIQTQISVDILKLMQDAEEEKQLQTERQKIDKIGSYKYKNRVDLFNPSQKIIQQTLDDRKTKRTSGKSIKSRKNQKDKVYQFESRGKLNQNIKKQRTRLENKINFIKTTSLYDVFWANLSKKCLNRQQKYIVLLDLTYAYLKISKNFHNKVQISKKSTFQQQVVKSQIIQKQFLKFIQQSTCNSKNLSNIPILVKLCYRLKQIHDYIRVNKDLVAIRNMCMQMKNNIYQQLPKEINKQVHRNQQLNLLKQKNDSTKCMKSTYLNSLSSQISINNTIRHDQSNVNLKDQNIPQIQSIQQVINKRLLDVDKQKFIWKFKNIKGIQSYSDLFVWRLDSCIVFINQILNRQQIYKKEQFLKYLKMGKRIRDTWVCNKIELAQQKRVEKSENENKISFTNKIFDQKTTKQLKTTKIIPCHSLQTKDFLKNKFILQKLLFTYSNIVKYSKKLKQTKYYDMIIMELQISYRYLYKMIKKNNFHSFTNIQDPHGVFQLPIQSNIKDIFDFRGKISKKNTPKARIDSADKKVQFVGIPKIIQQQKITYRNKQSNSKRSFKQLKKSTSRLATPSSNTINYEEIHKQIQQQEIKKQKQAYNNYFKQDSYTKAQQNFLQLLQESKRRNNFAKSLHFITNRSSKTNLSKQKFHSKHVQVDENKSHRSTINYHINLDGVVKDKICQSNSQTMKINNRKALRKGSGQQSLRNQLINNNQNFISNAQNKNIIQTYDKQTGQVFGLVKRSIKKSNNSPNKNGNSSDINSNPSFQLIKVKKRLGTLDRRHSFKKQIINLISITKRNIKPGRYFNQVKDAQNNRYRSILSTQQRVTILTKQRLLDQISNIYQINYQKPRPTFNQVLITPGSVTQKNSSQQEDSYSFKGINTGTNINLPSKKLELTMIQCFRKTIGFLNIKMVNPTKMNEYEITYTSLVNRLINQKIIISTKGLGKQDQSIFKSIFNFQQLKKQIINSEFYFELIQENIEKNIQGSDIYMIQEYFHGLDAQNSKNNLITKQVIQNSSLLTIKNVQKQAQMFNTTIPKMCFNIYGNTNNFQKILEEKQKANKIQSIVFAFSQRIAHSLLHWYYTKGIKINGNILLKRQIPYISDPLKFAIAIDFMKKFKYKKQLQKLSNVRNKKALYQCFRYLFYGRKIIIKGFLSRKSAITFYTLSLQRFLDSQFVIRTKGQGYSQFRDLIFTLTIYNKSGSIQIQKSEYQINQVLSSKQITLLMLSNLIQHQINPKYMQSLIIYVQMKQSSTISSKSRQPYYHQYGIIEQNCLQQSNQSQDTIKLKLHNQYSSDSIIQQLNSRIKNYGNLLFAYVDIIGGCIGFNISCKFNKVVKVDRKYYLIEEIFLTCGLVLHKISCVQNKDKIIHITMYEIKDLQQLIKKLKHKKALQMNGQRKQLGINHRIQSQGEMKIGLTNRQIRKCKKIIRALSYQNYNHNRNTCSNNHWQQCNNNEIEKQQNFINTDLNKNRINNKKLLNKYLQHKIQDSQLINAYQYRFSNISKNINESFLQFNPQFKNRKSAYHSRIVVTSPRNSNRNLINKIKKSIIQKEEMDFIQMINQSQEKISSNKKDYTNIKVKKIIKVGNNYLYISIFFNKFINAFRVDLYQTVSSNRFSGYFKLQQYSITEQFIENFFNCQQARSHQSFYQGSQKRYYDTYYNHNYYNEMRIDTINQNIMQRQEQQTPAKILVSPSQAYLKRQNSMIFSSTQTLNVRSEVQRYQVYPFQSNQQKNLNEDKEEIEQKQYNYLQNRNKINIRSLFVLYLLNYNHFVISQDLKSINFLVDMTNKNKGIRVSLFPTFNNLSSFEGRNQGKLQLIQINTKLYLLIIFQNNPNLYLSEVDDNPYMNNVNLFADFKAKEHLVNLYTDLFMRMFVKFEGSTLIGKFYQKIRQIGNI